MTEQPSSAPPEPAPEKDEAFWRAFLEQGGDTWKGIGRQVFRRIPADPRCRMCASPFRGPGAPLMRLIGKRLFEKPDLVSRLFLDFLADEQPAKIMS